MMKKTFKLASLTFLMFGCAVASEFRPALNLERGSQRYDLVSEKNDKEAWDIDVWSIMYSRNGNKAFGKHGTKTNPLSALIFGKSEFKVSDAFAAGMTTGYSQEFNANLNTTTLNPRVTYDEKGVNLGASVGYRVMGGKGKLGVKFNVPVKTVRMERDNNAETVEAGGGQTNAVFGAVQGSVTVPIDVTAANSAIIDAALNGGARSGLAVAPINAVASDFYKVSAVKDLPFVAAGGVNSFIRHEAAGGGRVAVGGQSFTAGGAPTYAQAVGLKETAEVPFVFFYHPEKNTVPNITARAVKLGADIRGANNQGNNMVNRTFNPVILNNGAARPVAGAADGVFDICQIQGNVIQAGGVRNTLVADLAIGQAPANNAALDITHVATNGVAAPVGANLPFARLERLDPAGPIAAPVAETLYAFPALVTANNYRDNVLPFFEQYKDNLWMMTVSQPDGTTRVGGGNNEALKGMLNRYASESAEQWLFRNGYTMQNNQRTGLGDITVNPYYEHSFSAAWNGGVYAHISIPTGGSRKMGDNPYKARLGNDNHFELGAGANVAWQALDWMNVRLDAMAAYALPAKERIAAPFKGATVRALGPTVDADIDYTRIKASLDSTFVHPRTSSLATTIGYDFEFKTKDNVSLKSKDYTFKNLADDANSWFGGTWDNGVGGFRAKTAELDSGVAAKNTENISHQFRMETSWKATSELSLFWGASSTPFGQNTMKATTVYGGMSVDF